MDVDADGDEAMESSITEAKGRDNNETSSPRATTPPVEPQPMETDEKANGAPRLPDEAMPNKTSAEATDDDTFVDKWTLQITRLAEERKRLKADQRAKTKEIKKAVRQKRRTMRNAKKLTDDELVQIVLDRRIAHCVEFEHKEYQKRNASTSSTPTS